MEKHVHCPPGEHFNCYRVLWYLSKGTHLHCTDGWTHKHLLWRRHGDRSLRQCKSSEHHWNHWHYIHLHFNRIWQVAFLAGCELKRVRYQLLYLYCGSWALNSASVCLYYFLFLFFFLLQCVVSLFLCYQTYLVSLKTWQKSIMFITSEWALGCNV